MPFIPLHSTNSQTSPEGEILHDVQVKVKLVVVLHLAAPRTLVEIAVRVNDG
jgi:hypothetical protein